MGLAVCFRKVASGSSYLLPEEANEIFVDGSPFRQLEMIKFDLPLVCTPRGKLYFRRFYEYEDKFRKY